jgi:hypothetical protein
MELSSARKPKGIPMLESIVMTLAALAVFGVVCVGGVLWLRKRRNDQALTDAAEDADQEAKGGGPRPKK